VGGKRNLAARLVRLIEAVPHAVYAEPFVGMGGVFLRRDRRPRIEIVNDAARDVANLFRVLQVHYVPFLEMLRYQLTTRAEFDRLCATDPATLTDMQRAARFLCRHFGMDHRPGAFDVTKLAPMLEQLHERLAAVTIEQLPFDRFITRYDRQDVLFFLDPPYWGSEDYYGAELFSRPDFERLRGLLEALKGRFILTINDRPETRAMFGQFSIEPVSLSYGLAGGTTVGKELIITDGRS
jgi:DNA adenine methylase